jgi:hypothetical protein
MASMLAGRSRASHLIDAVTLAYTAGAIVLLALARTSAVGAIGVVFAIPLLLRIGVRIVRGLYFAMTGRNLRISATGQILDPPERLGRPSWERRPNVRCS